MNSGCVTNPEVETIETKQYTRYFILKIACVFYLYSKKGCGVDFVYNEILAGIICYPL